MSGGSYTTGGDPLVESADRGLGGALAGWLLAAYGYVEGGAEQTVLALTGIKLLISVFPGVLYTSCAFALLFYNLDEATVATMKRELEERRGEETPEAAE